MVIGNGLIADAFKVYNDDNKIVVFASGVSNSSTIDPAHFARERDLLLQSVTQHPDKKLLYFSTCSILDTTVNTEAYVIHKREMEALIKEKSQQYLIVRLSNVVGQGGNKNTLINYLYNAVQNNKAIQLWKHAERNVIDQQDLVLIVSELLKNKKSNGIVNVATSINLSVEEMLNAIEKHLNKSARYSLIDKGSPLPIDTSQITAYLKQIEIKKGRGISYFEELLSKYY